MPARLDCPMCGVTVAEGDAIAPGACPGCGAAYAGGGDDPPTGTAMAMAHWGVTGMDARTVADGLFRMPPADPLNRRVTPISDHRDGFYRWWLFVARGESPAEVLALAAEHAAPR